MGRLVLDWGDQLVRLRRKGSGSEQWVPAGTDAFVWLRLLPGGDRWPGPQ